MVFNKFSFHVTVRVIVIVITSFLFVSLLKSIKHEISTVFAGIILLYLIYNLIHYVNKTNRDLSKFLIHLKEKDTSIGFSGKNMGKTFQGLYQTFDKINNEIRKNRIESEYKQIYIQNIVEHIGVGIIAYNDSGKLELMNQTARNYLGIPHLQTLKAIEKRNAPFVNLISRMKPGEEKLFRFTRNGQLFHFAIRCAQFIVPDKMIKLISFQNITLELEESELDNWQKIIRILTHEIMNSITPITTLTTAIKKALVVNNVPASPPDLTVSRLQDVIECSNLIEERAEGLTDFVHKYRSITLLPDIKPVKFSMHTLFRDLERMLNGQMKSLGITFQWQVSPVSLSLLADRKLVEQMLINLLKNAIEAVEGIKSPTINMEGFQQNDRVLITLKDNGKGISTDNIENIFMPFFTTKEGGSGIGLSLSRQIMRMHKGTITVRSEPEEETVFILKF